MPASRAATPQGAEFCGAGGTYESAAAGNTMIESRKNGTPQDKKSSAGKVFAIMAVPLRLFACYRMGLWGGRARTRTKIELT